MATTASDILTYAARAIGYLGKTETLSAADANLALVAFNNMLDSWSLEKLNSYVELQRNFTMVAGTQSYTIGSGGVINTTRPTDITSAFVRDSNSNDYPMFIINRQDWDNIGDKTITSQIPDQLFYSSDYPLGTIYIFPIPLLGYTVYYNSTTLQTTFVLTDTLSVPPGYLRAYVLNLAVELVTTGFPMLLDARGEKRLLFNAAEAKGNIKRMNLKEVKAEYDPSIVSRSQATYNIYSDSFPRGS